MGVSVTDLLAEDSKLFIGGEWVSPAGRDRVSVVNPAYGETIGSLPDPGRDDADRAVAAARAAFDRGPWPRMDPAERWTLVRRFCDELERRASDLETAWTLEVGATEPCTRAMNRVVPKAAWDDALRVAGERGFTEMRDGGPWGPIEVHHTPIGVVVAILTYNGPVNHMGLKVAPALLAGCPVIIKPSPETQLVGSILASAARAAELPAGVISVLAGGVEVSSYLVRHPGVDMVSFTGGTKIGRDIASVCGGRLAKCTLELGGKSAAIVGPDMAAEEGVPLLLPGMLTLQGQICNALSRILVPGARYDEYLDALSAAFEGQVVGDPLEPSTTWGPLAVERARDRVETEVAAAVAAGASVITGGRRPAGHGRGFFFEPTLVTDVTADMRVVREELFGPVYCVMAYDDIPSAIELANDTTYGLFGAVFTNDVSLGRQVARQVRAGSFAINGGGPCLTQPFGGVKDSGFGREGGLEGLYEFTEMKTVVLEKYLAFSDDLLTEV